MKISFTILILLLAIACDTKPGLLPKEKLSNIRVHFNEKLREFDSTAKVDSFVLVRLDTLRLSDKFVLQYLECNKSFDELAAKVDEAIKERTSARQQAELSNGLSASLYSFYKSKHEESKLESEKLYKELNLRKALCDSIYAKTSGPDSSKIINYEGVSFCQYRRKDMSVVRDTFRVVLTLSYDIVTREDWVK